MIKFITTSQSQAKPEQVLNCAGNVFVTNIDNKQVVLCSFSAVVNNKTIYTTTLQELVHKADRIINFLPNGAAEQGDIYPGTEITSQREGNWLYATEPISISGLLRYGNVLATSKKEPLILFYQYIKDTIGLFLYDIKYKTTTEVRLIKVDNVNQIKDCKFDIGAFGGNTHQDIFASCKFLNFTNSVILKENNYLIDDNRLGNWCNELSNPSVLLGNFNGDGLTDLLCVSSQKIMLNMRGIYREVSLLNNLNGNWPDQFSGYSLYKSIAVGDFDGNGVSDLVSLTNSGMPEILFHNGLDAFQIYSNDLAQDGAIKIYSIQNWCGLDQNAQLEVIDADNDGKDDILCNDNIVDSNRPNELSGNVYIAISRTEPVKSVSLNAISRVVVSLDEFVIGENIEYSIIDKNVPLYCDASNIYEYRTKLSCSLDSPNMVQSFSLPIIPNINIPEFVLSARIISSINLANSENYGSINSVNEQFIQKTKDSKRQEENNFLLEDINFVDPARKFNSQLDFSFIGAGKVNEQKIHFEQTSYGYQTNAGACTEINLNHITLKYNFAAKGKMEAFDQNNNKITDHNLIRSIGNLYILKDISTESTIANNALFFSYLGTINLQTLYQKNVTYCNQNTKPDGLVSSTQSEQNFVSRSASDDESLICIAQNFNSEFQEKQSISPGHVSSITKMKRSDVLEMNGIIHSGGLFFPDAIKNNITEPLEVNRYGTQVSDIHSRLIYSNGIILNAYLKGNGENFAKRPHNELMVDFVLDDQVIYEPTRLKFPNGTVSEKPASLYAGFDNIRSVKLAAFDALHSLLGFSIYQPEEQQYYLIIDYLNTGNNLLRIPIYDQNFNFVITDQRVGNEFFITYKSATDSLVIGKYLLENFALLESVYIKINNDNNPAKDIESNGLTNYQVRVDELVEEDGLKSSIIVIRDHNNQQGQFIKKYDVFLTEIESESNILCDAYDESQLNLISPKIDESYDVLKLQFDHNSKVRYHGASLESNLEQKNKLQNSLNFINNGLIYLEKLSLNQDLGVRQNFQNTVGSILCKSSLKFDYISSVAKKVKSVLSSDLTYEIHSETSNPECKNNNYYPVYRVNNIVHLCPGFDLIADNFQECKRFIYSAGYIKNLIPQANLEISTDILSAMITYFPSNVISSYIDVIRNIQSSTNAVSVCHEASSYGSNVGYNNLMANNIIAGLLSNNEQKLRISSNLGTSNCQAMVSRDCSTSYDKEANNLCFANLVEMLSVAAVTVSASSSYSNPKFNCVNSCDLNNIALKDLSYRLGGYLTRAIDDDYIRDDYHIRVTTNPQLKQKLNSNYGGENLRVLSSSSIYFSQDKTYHVTFAYAGNNYIDIKSQFFQFNSTDPISTTQHLGRFSNIKQIASAAFNQTAIITGYSVKDPQDGDYHLLVHYISPSISKVINIYPSFNGLFAIDSIYEDKNSGISDSEFVISYAENAQTIAIKRYKVTSNAIFEQIKITQNIPTISNGAANTNIEDNYYLACHALKDNSFNFVWSYYNSNGIFIQRYDLLAGNSIGNVINFGANQDSSLQIIETDSNGYKTSITWQNQNQIYSSLVNKDSYNLLNVTTCNMTLKKSFLIDQDVTVIELLDEKNTTKTIFLNANSGTITDKYNLDYDDQNLQIIKAIGSTAEPFKMITNSISDTCDINQIKIQNLKYLKGIIPTINFLDQSAPQGKCTIDGYKNSALVLSQMIELLQNKTFLVDQLDAVEINVINQVLSNLKIQPNTIYDVHNLNKVKFKDYHAELKDSINFLDKMNINMIPETDISSQISDLKNALDSIVNSNSNNKKKFDTESFSFIGEIAERLFDMARQILNLEVPTGDDELVDFIADTAYPNFRGAVKEVAEFIIGAIEDLVD